MDTQLRLIPFFAFRNIQIPRHIAPEFKVEKINDDDYKIIPAPLVIKDGNDFDSLYINYDKLLPEYRNLYAAQMCTFSVNENGTYKLETRIYSKDESELIENRTYELQKKKRFFPKLRDIIKK